MMVTHTTGPSDNLYSDLGFSPEESAVLNIKTDLMIKISLWIKDNQLTQADAAEIFGVTRPRISDVQRGKFDKFTIDALVSMLEKANYHVTFNAVLNQKPIKKNIPAHL